MAKSAKSAALVGANGLSALVRRHGSRPVARALDAEEASVRRWVAGKAEPRPAAREKMLAVYGLVWDGAPATAEPVAEPMATSESRPVATAAPSDEAPRTGAVDAHEEAKATVRQLRAAMDRLEADPLAAAREVAAVATSLTSATRVLGRFSGATDLTAPQILRSSEWRKVSGALIEAVRPFPGALDAIAKALRALDGQP